MFINHLRLQELYELQRRGVLKYASNCLKTVLAANSVDHEVYSERFRKVCALALSSYAALSDTGFTDRLTAQQRNVFFVDYFTSAPFLESRDRFFAKLFRGY